VFESIYFTPQLFCTIGIFKHTNVACANDTILDIIKLEMNCNCITDAFKKLNHCTFFVLKFNIPCGSHFIVYFKRLKNQ